MRQCEAVDCYQDGFRLDGSWNGHRQRAEDVLFERSGFYVQSARLVGCTVNNNRKAGFLCKNQEAGSLSLL